MRPDTLAKDDLGVKAATHPTIQASIQQSHPFFTTLFLLLFQGQVFLLPDCEIPIARVYPHESAGKQKFPDEHY